MTERLAEWPSAASTDGALRIALATDTFAPQINGVARTLERTVRAMRARGHDVRVFAPFDPDAAPNDDLIQFPSRPFWAYPQLRLTRPDSARMRRELIAWSPDIVHVATPFGVGLSARSAARPLRVPLISSYHTSLATYATFYGLGALSQIGWSYLRWFHNGTLATLCPTRAIARELEAHRFRHVDIWGRGIDTAQFNPRWRSEALRASWGAGPETVVVAYVGRLAAEKGLDVTMRAMSAVGSANRNVVFVVAGDGPYEAECRRLAPDRCTFTGRIEGRTLSEVFASADVFVFSSTTDTFGNVVQEAMASRLAVVAADVPQTREVLEGCGLLVPPARVADLAAAIHQLIESPMLLESLREGGFVRAASRSWDHVFAGLEASYRSAIGAEVSTSEGA